MTRFLSFWGVEYIIRFEMTLGPTILADNLTLLLIIQGTRTFTDIFIRHTGEVANLINRISAP
jgi:hypothetical protein